MLTFVNLKTRFPVIQYPDMKHELIIDREFFDRYDLPVDSRKNKLVLPESWPRENQGPEIPRENHGECVLETRK